MLFSAGFNIGVSFLRKSRRVEVRVALWIPAAVKWMERQLPQRRKQLQAAQREGNRAEHANS